VSSVPVAAGTARETRTVPTGLTSGAQVEITSGLEAGETVVIALPGAGGGPRFQNGDQPPDGLPGLDANTDEEGS
jgi:hypothetical protein